MLLARRAAEPASVLRSMRQTAAAQRAAVAVWRLAVAAWLARRGAQAQEDARVQASAAVAAEVAVRALPQEAQAARPLRA
ncbi:hypothetical protein GCM10027093_20660 [Paraburkholderia jirisanensis]